MATDKKILEGYLFYAFFLLALLTVFFSQGMNLGFDNYPHGYLSSHGMALSENILRSDSIFMYNSVSLAEGKLVYDSYNRFAPLSFLLIKAVSVVADTYDMSIYMARQLMHVFFVLSFMLVFLMAKLFLKDRMLSLICAFFVFSSFYFMHYANMVFVDIPSLCCFCAALYLALASGRGKSFNVFAVGALVVFSAATAWQSGAVYALWFLIEGAKKLFKKDNNLKTSFLCLVGFSLISLSFFWYQLYLEHFYTGRAFVDLPTVKSVMFRLGFASDASYDQYAERLSYLYFVKHEAFRIVRLMIPFYAEIYWSSLSSFLKLFHILYLFFVVSMFIVFAKLKSKLIKAEEILLLVASGFFWTVPMRMHVAFHDFQTIFYIGIPVCFYVFCCSAIRGKKLLFMTVAFLLFVFNVFLAASNKASHQKDASIISKEFDIIKPKLQKGAKVFLKDKDLLARIGRNTGSYPLHAMDYYLAGCVYAEEDNADYVIADGRSYNDRLQTDNKNLNLFLR